MARNAQMGSGCLVLFSLPFAAVGVGVGFWLLSGIVTHSKMQQWQETPAKIVWAKLESHSGSKGGTTYQATAEYSYQFDGRQYTGRRVSLSSGSDNIGSYQQEVHRQLSQYQTSGRPFRCYVNPQQPADAILFRDLRWEMVAFQALFAEVFGAVGFGLLTGSVLGFFQARGNRALATLYPEEPWRWKREWADGKISSSNRTSAIVLLVAAFYWNMMAVPVLTVFPYHAIGKGNWLPLLLLVFPAVGLILILSVAVSVLRWRKYGKSAFEMAAVPGVIGGQLGGVIRVSKKVEPEEGFRQTLSCLHRVTTQNGKNSNTSENLLWQDEQLIARELSQSDPEQSAIPVLFQIPYECRPTDEAEVNNQTIWRLTVSAKTPGLDYAAKFEVPVFKTSESDPNFVVDRSVIAEYAAPENPERDFHDAGVIKTESPSGEGFRLIFPMGRAVGMGFVWLIIGCIFSGVPIFMYYVQAPWLLNIVFGVIFGGIGVLMLMAAVDVWFYRSVVDVSPAGLTVVGGLFGIGRQQQINAANIEKIEPYSRMNAGQGENAKVWYDIQVVYRPGKKLTVGKRILGKRLSQSVIRQIEQALSRS
jgi:hypothetical protein